MFFRLIPCLIFSFSAAAFACPYGQHNIKMHDERFDRALKVGVQGNCGFRMRISDRNGNEDFEEQTIRAEKGGVCRVTPASDTAPEKCSYGAGDRTTLNSVTEGALGPYKEAVGSLESGSKSQDGIFVFLLDEAKRKKEKGFYLQVLPIKGKPSSATVIAYEQGKAVGKIVVDGEHCDRGADSEKEIDLKGSLYEADPNDCAAGFKKTGFLP
jgi:hypothetical protein